METGFNAGIKTIDPRLDLRFYSGYKTALRDAYQWFENRGEFLYRYKLLSYKGIMFLLKKLIENADGLINEGSMCGLNITLGEIKKAGGGWRKPPKKRQEAAEKRRKELLKNIYKGD